MGARLFNLVILLAMTIALVGDRAGWCAHRVDAGSGEHVHLHDHSSDLGVDSHTHHHHHSEDDDEDSDDHHSDLDHLPDAPKIHRNGPRRVETDAPPVHPSQVAGEIISISEAESAQQAKPSHRSLAHAQHLNSIRTIILRL